LKKIKEYQHKLKTFHLDKITKSKTDELAHKIAAFGIKPSLVKNLFLIQA